MQWTLVRLFEATSASQVYIPDASFLKINFCWRNDIFLRSTWVENFDDFALAGNFSRYTEKSVSPSIAIFSSNL